MTLNRVSFTVYECSALTQNMMNPYRVSQRLESSTNLPLLPKKKAFSSLRRSRFSIHRHRKISETRIWISLLSDLKSLDVTSGIEHLSPQTDIITKASSFLFFVLWHMFSVPLKMIMLFLRIVTTACKSRSFKKRGKKIFRLTEALV